MGAVGGDEGDAFAFVELERVLVDAIVDGEGIVASDGVVVAVLVGHDILAIGELRDGCHAGPVRISRVFNVRDDWAPVAEIGRGLVDKVLAEGCVHALVGVVDDDLRIVHPI